MREPDDTVVLTPDMSKVWGRVLKKLREQREDALHTACMDLKDIEFTNYDIKITVNDDAMYTLFNKYLIMLNNFAGSDIIKIYKTKQSQSNPKKVEELKKLFGDKIRIV